MRKAQHNIFILVLLLLVAFAFTGSVNAQTLPFTEAYITTTNARFSFRGLVTPAVSANGTGVVISTADTNSDKDTANLFPRDIICFYNDAVTPASCGGNGTTAVTYYVGSVPSTDDFSVTTGITTGVLNNMYAVSSQSARLTVTFKPKTTVPSGGTIVFSIPSASTKYNDGIPDGGTPGGYYDAGSLTNGNITANTTILSGGGYTAFTASLIALTNGSNLHTITLTLSAPLYAGTQYGFTVGSASDPTLRFINPSSTGTRTRGAATALSATLATFDGATALDRNTLKIAINDGVLVSATVEESLTYTLTGVSADSGSYCGVTRTATSPDSTATTVPFGSITSFDTFYDAQQVHTVTTNTANGYVLTAQYDGVMKRDGTGATADTQIAATTCQATACTVSAPQTWTAPATYRGFGYALEGTDVPSGQTYTNGYKPFDVLTNTPVVIATRTGTASSVTTNTCYRLVVPATTTAGYYFNKIYYIAYPRF